MFGLFDPSKDLPAFKNLLRDFLVQLKQFSSGDNADLFLEEKEAQQAAEQAAEQKRLTSVPGLLPQNQVLQDEMND